MSLIAFVCSLIVGVISVAVSLALGLTVFVGSPILAWFIVGLLFIGVAVAIYYFSLHDTIKRIDRRLDTIYEVSATVERSIHKVALYLKKIVAIFLGEK